MKTYTETELTVLAISEYAKLKKQYKGYLGEKNKPNFIADSYVFQSTIGGVVHFHYGLN